MIRTVRQLVRSSRLLNFNQVDRDRWIRKQAQRVPAGARVLDVGAGSCPYRDLFAACDYRTQDFAELPAGQLGGIGYGHIDYRCDAANMPIAKSSFDVVLCTEVLEHIAEPVLVVREFARVLKPGGRVILTAPLGSGIHQEPHHYYGGFTPYWYQHFLAEAGFEDIRVEPNNGSFRFFAQEGLRFIKTSRPFRSGRSLLAEFLWAPVWLLLLPLLGLVVPIAARYLDAYDNEPQLTVGYHVTAVRKTD